MKDFWAEGLQDQRKGKLKKLAVFIGLTLIIIAIAVIIIVYMCNLNFRTWCDENVLNKEVQEQDTDSIELDGDENTQIYAYDKYICIFRKKTLQFYNKVGTKIEEIELDINKAVFTSAGRYMVICEEDGQKFYLISGKEKIFENEVEGNISKINVSRNGYIAIVLSNSSYKSIVDVYNKSGKEIFKTNLVTSRVSDVSISQDSKYLAIAEIDISGVLIKSSIQIVSIDLAQTNPSEATLNKYEAPIDKLILNIEYQEKNKLVCMYSDSIEILEDNESKEITDLSNNKLAFMTINLNNKIALLEEVSTGEYTSDTYVSLINTDTLNTKQYIANDVAKSIETTNNRIAINFGTELHIINSNGILLKKYISEKEINDIVMTDSLVGIIYRDKIQIINL
jgi:WD40 repeat protein